MNSGFLAALVWLNAELLGLTLGETIFSPCLRCCLRTQVEFGIPLHKVRSLPECTRERPTSFRTSLELFCNEYLGHPDLERIVCKGMKEKKSVLAVMGLQGSLSKGPKVLPSWDPLQTLNKRTLESFGQQPGSQELWLVSVSHRLVVKRPLFDCSWLLSPSNFSYRGCCENHV